MTVAEIDGQLKVILSDAETVKYNIDCVFFESNSRESSKALITLLKLAASKVGFSTDAKDFAIEIYPIFSGGCEIYFIPEKPKVPKVSATVNGWSVFEFNSTESALKTCELLYKDPKTRYCFSSMYKYCNKYRLVVKNISSSLNRRILLEFADCPISSRLERVKTFEYGKPIALKNAIYIIGSALVHEKSD
jgi:hypothetical protein